MRASAVMALTVPAVPYLPQTEALCGGASLAMVLRYWGTADVRPEDFAGALTANGTGITTETLTRLAVERGFEAVPFRGEPSEVVHHLENGRPVIALVSSGGNRHHYVVILAWANQRVLVHDPAVGPYRVIKESEWRRAWSGAGNWALLVVPREKRAAPAEPSTPAEEARPEACAGLVQPAIEMAQRGETEAANERLVAAAAWCPEASAPLRERAGLEFRAEHWAAAASFAEEAVGRDPSDAFAWRLLATSRFLDGRRDAALEAWNRIDLPRLDLVQIDGLDRLPYRSVYSYLGPQTGELLTAAGFRRARRRVEDLPGAQAARVDYRPLAEGKARLEVALVERPAFTPLRSLLLHSAVGLVSQRTISVDPQLLTRNGDTAHLLGQWQPNRLRGLLGASAPRVLGLPGIVTVEALWDEQTYRLAPETPAVRERRRRASFSISDWWTGDTRARVSLASDSWSGRGSRASLSALVDQRLLRDHLSIGAGAAGWWLGAPFYTASGRVSARTRTAGDGFLARIDAAYGFASQSAPLALWPGAGTGAGREMLLRAHPLVHGGIIDGPAFGRQLWTGTAQLEGRIASVGPVNLKAAAFADAAAVRGSAPRATLVDIGAGLRVHLPGSSSSLRVDVATPSSRFGPHLSAGWQAAWPN